MDLFLVSSLTRWMEVHTAVRKKTGVKSVFAKYGTFKVLSLHILNPKQTVIIPLRDVNQTFRLLTIKLSLGVIPVRFQSYSSRMSWNR